MATHPGGRARQDHHHDDPTAGDVASGGNWLFGNFNQNGVRDLSAVQAAQDAQAKLFRQRMEWTCSPVTEQLDRHRLATPLPTCGQSQYAAGHSWRDRRTRR